ncbi:MAG: ATP-binding protein [Sandaracinaceae bacterium]
MQTGSKDGASAFDPDAAGLDPNHARRVRVSAAMLGTLFLADAAVVVTRLWTDTPAPLALPFFVLLIGLALALRRGAIRVAAHGTCAVVVTTVLGMTYLAGRLPPMLHVFAVIPLFATFVLGRRAGLFWFLTCVAALLAAKLGVAYLPVPLPTGREMPALSVLITVGLAFAVVYAFEAQRSSSARAISNRDADARALLALLPDVVLRVGPSGLLQNSAPARLSNADAQMLLGQSVVSACLSGPLDDLGELAVDLEGRALTVRLVPIEDADDVLVLVRDTTHAQRLEERATKAELIASLERANRMSSLGVMAACIAHEVNNPLAYLAGNLSFLGQRAERDAPIDDEHREAIHDAIDATDRVRAIVGELKHYAREDAEAAGPVSVQRIVAEATKLVRNELKHSATVVVEGGEPRWVAGVESRLVQVVLNLLLNASQAFDADGAEDNRVWIRIQDDDGNVVIRVADNGPGIPDELLHRVSRPFFTTKASGQGTGLGLAVCEEIVVQSRGELRIRNRPEGGAEISIHLPRVQAPKETPAAPPKASMVELRPSRILVIDDEPLVRRALVRLLREHEVVEAESGLEGLAQMEEGAPFDAILCDVMMPQLSGLDVYERMREEHPDLTDRLVLMSGGAFDPRLQELLSTFAEVPLIDKPFDLVQLHAALDSRLHPSAE